MKFNINDYVRVRLNDYGREILCREELTLPKEDSDGWSEWQMWTLMNEFGEYIYLGCRPPFETEIEIVEKEQQCK